jgi:hypothetical protein
MKISMTIFLAVSLFFVLVIVLCMNSGNYITPYNDASIVVNSYPNTATEGFTNSPSEYVKYPTYESVDFLKNNEINASKDNCFKVSGQNGLVCSPTEEPSNPTDIFSKSKGSADCQSFGLMNSKGYVCLDEKQKNLYTTRGGNATGGNGDIGLFTK